jgi:RAD3-like DEAD/DEAH box helicase
VAEYLSTSQAIARLQNPEPLGGAAFDVMRFVAEQFATRVDDDSSNAIEIAIRLLERRGELNGFEPVLNSLLRMVGLFPYLLPESLSISDQLAFEAHRPLGMTDLVLHRVQGELYRRALAGENILLSAPTSFGKSLIVDALLASGRYDNSVVLVPTLALIDEVRRRLSRFSDTFKIITHPSQRPDERNVYVLTQERLLDLDTMPPLDLFIIDEFYKLDSRREPFE